MSGERLSQEPTELQVEPAAEGQRLDAFLAEKFARHSRVQLRRVVTSGGVTVDGRRAKAAYRLKAGQRVSIAVPDLPRAGPQPEAIPLEVLYEDDDLAAINTPPGMVVHPSKGHWSGTLTAALAHHFTRLSSAGGPTRPGIVHRLDRDTSGVLVVAKTDEAHLVLAAQFEQRTARKQYLAITAGVPDRDQDYIEQPIGAHPYQREKMAIRAGHSTSRPARTFYRVRERFGRFALVEVLPQTGRTHQIRVHLAHLGCPVLCDKLYGGRAQITAAELHGGSPRGPALLTRQALHAWRLTIRHPTGGQELTFEAPLPHDLEAVLAVLRGDSDSPVPG